MIASARAGLVLPIVLAAIVILGLAAASGTLIERTDARVVAGDRLRALASAESELAAVAAFDDLSAVLPLDLRVGSSLVRRHRTADPAAHAVVTVARLGETLFSILAVAEAADARGVRARDGNELLVRVDARDEPLTAALATRDPPILGGAVVDGRDAAPDDEHCPPAGSDDTPTEALIDSTALDSTLAVLRSRATKRFPASTALADLAPTVVSGGCERGDALNWGDPTRSGPCGSYLPVVHATGDLAVAGGVGQGVLIVDGDLEIGGALDYAGLIVVAGRLSVTGAGAKVLGGIVTSSADFSAAGPTTIQRSSCRVRRALLAAAPLVPVVERPWTSVR
jgi:hypothetical protein